MCTRGSEQSGLARAIRPDQSYLLARIELERSLDEQRLMSVPLADAGERDHEPGRLERKRRWRNQSQRTERGTVCSHSSASPPPAAEGEASDRAHGVSQRRTGSRM